MIGTIVGCGQSAENWVPRGISIGVNDALKWGKPIDQIIVVNTPNRFDAERMRFIQAHKGKFYTNLPKAWQPYVKQAELLRDMGEFHLRINKGRIYTSETSPICAISHAINQDATKVILWGVDMKNHKRYSQGTKHGDHEIGKYLKFFDACRKISVEIYLGATGTAFDNDLPLWQQETNGQ